MPLSHGSDRPIGLRLDRQVGQFNLHAEPLCGQRGQRIAVAGDVDGADGGLFLASKAYKERLARLDTARAA